MTLHLKTVTTALGKLRRGEHEIVQHCGGIADPLEPLYSLSPPPPASPPSPSTSLLSLPIEILHSILFSIPEKKAHQLIRRTALVNLSLVNRFLSQVARPLLYERVPFHLVRYDVKQGYSRHLLSLIKTFEDEPGLIKFVKHVDVSLGSDASGWPKFTRFLPEMKHLRAISVHDIGNWFIGGKISHLSDLFNKLSNELNKVKTIEVNKRLFNASNWNSIVFSSPRLEHFIIALDLNFLDSKRSSLQRFTIPASSSFRIPLNLRQIAITAPIDQNTFDCSLSSSYNSLTYISLVVSHKPLNINLAPLSGLESLHLDFCLTLGVSRHLLDEYRLVIDHSKSLLLSARDLPIKTLKITTSNSPAPYLPHCERLLSAIPTSIHNLLIQSGFLTQGHWLSILPLTGFRRLYLLEHIGLYPPHDLPFDFVVQMPSSQTVYDFAPTCERFGINCEFF